MSLSSQYKIGVHYFIVLEKLWAHLCDNELHKTCECFVVLDGHCELIIELVQNLRCWLRVIRQSRHTSADLIEWISFFRLQWTISVALQTYCRIKYSLWLRNRRAHGTEQVVSSILGSAEYKSHSVCIEPTITRVPSVFSEYVWLDRYRIIRKEMVDYQILILKSYQDAVSVIWVSEIWIQL